MTTISSTAEHATEHVRHAASHAGASLVELSTQALRFINGVREAQGRGVETVLGRLGLQRRQSALGPVLWFAAGAITATTAVLLLSPASGKKLRHRLASFFRKESETATTRAGTVEPRVPESEAPVGHNGAKQVG
jgi:hypothetical protein